MAKPTIAELQPAFRDFFVRLRVGCRYADAMRVVSESWEWVNVRRRGRFGQPRRWTGLWKGGLSEASKHFEVADSVQEDMLPFVEHCIAAAPDRRPVMLEWWATLPTADRMLIEGYYLRPGDKVVGDMPAFTHLHLDLLHRLDREAPVPDTRPPETAETDLARLTLQRAVGDFPDDRRAVLEALLIGEPGNQRFYVRLTHAVAEMEWRFGPQPDWDAPPPPKPPLREQLVSWAFMAACCLALASVAYAIMK